MKRLVISALMAVLVQGAACMAQRTYDVNKDVHNGTDHPAYGFTIVLQGTPQLLSHFDGYPTKWRFRTFEKSIVGETTVLYWSDPLNGAGAPVPIPYCNWVHIGYRLDRPADILEAYWTDQNGVVLPGGQIPQPTQTMDLQIVNNRTLSTSLTIKNALRNGLTVTVNVAGYRLWDGQLGLDVLNGENPTLTSGLTPVPGAEGEITLTPGQSKTFRAEVPVSALTPGKMLPSVLLVKTKKDVFTDYAQFYPAMTVPPVVPALSHVGLIVMATLVLATGAIVIARCPRHTTA